jgi:hypothetical protein
MSRAQSQSGFHAHMQHFSAQSRVSGPFFLPFFTYYFIYFFLKKKEKKQRRINEKLTANRSTDVSPNALGDCARPKVIVSL